MESAKTILHRYWGPDWEFRGCQSKAIEALMNGNDVLVVMTTGGGKSLILQIPPLAMGKIGIVVSPLISLMQDQVQGLLDRGIRACLLGSAQTSSDSEALDGSHDIVYASPEHLLSQEMLERLREAKDKIGLIAVDEAHCISEWGHDYRTAYGKLGKIRSYIPSVPCLAVTATATGRVRSDILKKMNMFHENLFVFRTQVRRDNLCLSACPRPEEDLDLCKAILQRAEDLGPTIVYVMTTKQADYFHSMLPGSVCYHAKLDPQVRAASHRAFITNQSTLLVATVAYGMGIDKPDVRFVCNIGTPATLEAYYQQAGRAGRDGCISECILYWAGSDVATIDSFQSRHFSGDLVDCGMCDVCTMVSETRVLESVHRRLLTSIHTLGGRFGMSKAILLASGRKCTPLWLHAKHMQVQQEAPAPKNTDWASIAGFLVGSGLVEYKTVDAQRSFSAPRLTPRGLSKLRAL
ncbi:hypothetical protein CEUSTIGMA_g10750.t1 [Chlamydomonas eustigma]|uniref:DNA 3'-5' helicase n=1 Tax=Chlamydomonas eustigma TaxID=1157962 RepID=A0A250XJS0_9CHLO|nr:hypothetical protein CEUSTIGMA_g10750.t1 [Chlamydomonas eustigma]|eukprot:GAX83324.1 hypothetical protein CEUSTIGMA_g10750.t1 [Chlamydomonas eustigma]